MSDENKKTPEMTNPFRPATEVLPKRGSFLRRQKETILKTVLGLGESANKQLAEQISPGSEVKPSIEIQIDGKKVDANTKVIVGQRVRITMVPINGNEIAEPQWEIEGITKTKFVHELNDGHTEDIAPLQLKNMTVSFFWVDGAPDPDGLGKKVKATAKLDGQLVTEEVTISVIKPRVSINIGLKIPQTGVRLQNIPDSLADARVSLAIQIISPTVIEEDAVTTFVQLANSSRTQYRADGSSDDFHKSGLDGGFPYPTANMVNGSLVMLDTPYELLALRDRFNQESIRDEFTTWLMFRPGGEEGGVSNWVPMMKLDWSWWADVVLVINPIRWQINGGGYSFGAPTETNEYPAWDKHIPLGGGK